MRISELSPKAQFLLRRLIIKLAKKNPMTAGKLGLEGYVEFIERMIDSGIVIFGFCEKRGVFYLTPTEEFWNKE